MRILQIANNFPPRYAGGAEVAALHGAWGLLRRGVEVKVLSARALYPQAFDTTYNYHGLHVHEMGWPPSGNRWGQLFDIRIYHAVCNEIRTFRPDVIHLHNLSGCSLAPHLAALRLSVPLLQTLHDHWLLCPNNMLYRMDGCRCEHTGRWRGCGHCWKRYDYWAAVPARRAILRWITGATRFFISPSQKLIDLHVNAGYHPNRFRLLRYGFDFEHFRESEQSEKNDIPDPGDCNVIFFSGAIVETKGVDVLLRALPLLSRYIEKMELWMVGGGESSYLDQLRALAPANVRVLGYLPFHQVSELYSRAKLTVVPSIWFDNSPVVIYEAFAAGTPVLGAAIGGIPELIQNGITGYVFPAGDAASLAEHAIMHFAKPSKDLSDMRSSCRSFYAAKLNLDVHVDGLLSIIREALSGKHRHYDEVSALIRPEALE